MMQLTDLAALLGIALALALLCQRALGRWPLSKRRAAIIGGAVFVVLLLPFSDLPPAAYVRGMIGDLSISTLVLLAYGGLRRHGVLPPLAAGQRHCGLGLLVLAAALLYPLALGVAPYDVYRWGYGNAGLLGVLLALALLALTLRLPLIAATLSLAVLAWAAGVYESSNLWDYLIDPLLAIYAFVSLIVGLGARCCSALTRGR